jgi:APA family basic amino acid/polyamine antiporter
VSAPSLHRILGPFDGLAIVVGVVIGAGILRTPGLIAGYLGDAWLILALWMSGGVIASLAALVLAELGAMLPAAGGKYAFVRAAYGDAAGAFAGWAELLCNRSFTGAVKAVLIGEYVVLLAGGRGDARLIGAAVTLGYVLLHWRGIRAGRGFQNLSTVLKVVLLFAMVAAGFLFGDGASWQAGAAAAPAQGLLLGLVLAAQSVFFTYYGAEASLQMAEEMKNPQRVVPRMLLFGVGTVTLLYLLINTSFMHALTPAEMAGSGLVARDVLTLGLGPWGGAAVAVVALGILLSSLNYNFLGTPRIPFGLARDGLAPRTFLRVNEGGTPTSALCLTGALIFVLAVSGTFELLIRFMSFLTLVVDGIVLTTLFALRRRLPDRPRPFTVPWYPVLPGLVLLMYTALIVLIIVTQPELALGGAALLVTVGAASWVWTRRHPV